MGKSTMELDITAEKEFASLAQVLTITADDAFKCLKTLKNNLSEYDSQHGNHLLHTARLHMRSDIRHAKDVSADLKSVARQIHESHKPSKEGVASARTAMNAVTLAMDVLIVTAQRYDEKHSHSSDVKGAMESAVNGKDEMEKDVQRDVFGNSNYQAGHQGDLHAFQAKSENAYFCRPKTLSTLESYFYTNHSNDVAFHLTDNMHVIAFDVVIYPDAAVKIHSGQIVIVIRDVRSCPEIVAEAGFTINATADAMNDLIQSGHIYDQDLHIGVVRGVTSIIDKILGGNNSTKLSTNEDHYEMTMANIRPHTKSDTCSPQPCSRNVTSCVV
ncbi:unnamed protein product [Peronospora effusa]|nr:unnamed protein product [Peronospora effusa]